MTEKGFFTGCFAFISLSLVIGLVATDLRYRNLSPTPHVGQCFWVGYTILKVTKVAEYGFWANWPYRGIMVESYFPKHNWEPDKLTDCPEASQ